MQAKSLDHVAAPFLQRAGQFRKGVRGKQAPLLFQFLHVGQTVVHVFMRHAMRGPVTGRDLPAYIIFLSAVPEHGYDIVSHVVYRVDGAAAGIHDDVVTAKLVLMDHNEVPLYQKCRPGFPGGI